MDINYYKQYEPIFGAWTIKRLIGEGSFGKVFEMERTDFGVTYQAALKIITVPANRSEVQEVLSEGMDEVSARTYFGSFVEELVREFELMSRLKGNSNVVSYENHQVIEHKDDIGWDILIQMELLTPLNKYIAEHGITREDVLKLGIDLCKALELCQKFDIIHRDVKPENIFYSTAGDFKLGDFGIARTVEKTTSGLSKKGTYSYMAPEVYKGEEYGSTVDLYSLGIVLYRLLNGNRTPFLPEAPTPITHADRENALAKRFSGAPLPPPSHGKGLLAEIILKACAYDPKDRYATPGEMRQALEDILYQRNSQPVQDPKGPVGPMAEEELEPTALDESIHDPEPAAVDPTQKDTRDDAPPPKPEPVPTPKPEKKMGKLPLLIGAGAACLALVAGIALMGGRSSDSTAADGSAAPEDGQQEAVIQEPVSQGPVRIGVMADTMAARLPYEYLIDQYPTVTVNGQERPIELVYSPLYEDYVTDEWSNTDTLKKWAESYGMAAATAFNDADCDVVCQTSYTASFDAVFQASQAVDAPLLSCITDYYGDKNYSAYKIDSKYPAVDQMCLPQMYLLHFAAEELKAENILILDGPAEMTAYASALGVTCRSLAAGNDIHKVLTEDFSDYDAMYLETRIGLQLDDGSSKELAEVLVEKGYTRTAMLTDDYTAYKSFKQAGLTNVYYVMPSTMYDAGSFGPIDTFAPSYMAWLEDHPDLYAIYEEGSAVGIWGAEINHREYDAYQQFMVALQALEMGGDVEEALQTGTFHVLTGTFQFKTDDLDPDRDLRWFSHYTSFPLYHLGSDRFIEYEAADMK